MDIQNLSKMNNNLGIMGAIMLAQNGVINQWRADDKYSIIQFEYGLSIKNHENSVFPKNEVCEIIEKCLPNVKDYDIEQNESILRVIIRKEFKGE